MSMKKIILKAISMLPKVLLIVVMIFGATILNTCTAPEQNDIRKNEMSFNKDVFYFNRYVHYKMTGEARSVHTIYKSAGSIEIYGDVVKINRNSSDIIHVINLKMYDEESQIYEFYSDEVVLEFDVVNKRLTTYYEDGSGYVYYINSTIKSNW